MPGVLRALRGATTLDEDSAEQVRGRVQELVATMLERNEVDVEDLVSVIFTVTPDIVSGYPATAARELGLDEVPLLGAVEADVAGGLARCVRVLMHCYTERPRKDLRHVYLHGARSLRADLAG
ncbi:MAG TPA: chorismate mutase [Acidimicrobiales bacterium]|nr:chorismate mutase [Acidimicrobiales bacterium]